MNKAFASELHRSRRSVRGRLVFSLAFAVLMAGILAVPLLSKWTRRVEAAGDVSLNNIGTPVTQNFDGLAAAPTGTPVAWSDGTTLTGWYTQGTALNPTSYRADTGTSITGAIYSYGVAGTNLVTDRAFGSLASVTTGDNYFALKLTNNTGSAITGLLVSYNGEQWRQGGNPTAQKLDFQYQVASAGTITDANTPSTGWSDVDSLDFTSPVVSAPSPSPAAALDGNAAANRTAKSALVATGTVGNGQEIWLRWKDINDSGNDHGLAIDDFSVTPLGGSIGPNGYRVTDIQGTDDGGYAMVLQPDGKIVVGGYAVNGSQKDFALVRYNYDGSLDTTFNVTGKVTTDFNGTSDRIWGLALQSDGKIVAAGETVSSVFPGTNDIALARYNPDGTLDTSFNFTGKVTTDHGGGANNVAYAIALSGTNIIVAGAEQVSGNLDFMVAQYTGTGVSAGQLDPTFGTLGVTTLGFSGANDVARAVGIDSSNRIVLGGYANNGADDDFAVARFTSGGVLDTTFVAGAGKAAVNLGAGASADQAFALAIAPAGAPNAGDIILAGSTYNGSNKDFALVAYTSAGALDAAFGGSGIKKDDFNNSPDVAQSVFVRSDGYIVAGGFSRYGPSSDDFAIARYNSSGGPDTSFNGTGKLTFALTNNDDRIYGIAQEFDSKIVAAGFTTTPLSNPVQHDFAVARFNANGSIDSTNAVTLNSPDLLVEKHGPLNPSTAIAGQNFDYTITVTNRGGAPATNVVLTDPLPAAVTYVSHVASTGSSNQSAGTVTNNIGTLNAGATATLTITVTASNTPQLVSNTASATLTETDPTPANNSANETTRIIGLVDLSFSPGTTTGGCPPYPTGTVTLSAEAPFGGATVTITSGDPATASAPAQVTVLQGSKTANFMVTTNSVVSNKQVRFQADLGPTTFVRRINVNAGVCNSAP